MKFRATVIMVGLFLIFSQQAEASNRLESWQENKMGSSSYPEKASAMFLNGGARMIAAPFELLYHPYDQCVNEKKNLSGFFEGLGVGVYHASEDVVTGVTNVTGSVVPGFHGIRDLSRPK